MTSSSVRALLEARSVAVVGASTRRGSPGHQSVRQLVTGGFRGRVFPVNPRYREIEGIPCWPSLEAIPDSVDLVILGVPNRLLEEQLVAAGESGAEAAVIFASAYTPDGSLAASLARIASDGGISICGANCMGFVNFENSLRALAFAEPADLAPGHITWITHSGSAFTALLHNDRGLRFNLAVSAGQELTTTVADYLAYAVERPATRLVALFLETVRDPIDFRSALEAAATRDIPVVALKVGREAAAKRLVTAHSGALAGEDAVFEAVFEAHGVVRVRSLNEMADTLELLCAGRRARAGALAAIHDSGGERAHLIDAAAEVDVPLADISSDTVRRLEAVLDPGLPAVNPLDAWGTGNDYERIYLECMRALSDDPATAALAFVVDLAGEDAEWGYADVAERAFFETDLPMAVLSNLSSAIDPRAAERLRAAGVPVLEDTINGLASFRHLLQLRDHRTRPPVETPAQVDARVRAAWWRRLADPHPWGEAETLELLSDYGISVAPTVEVTDSEEAVEAARRLGYPVVLKATRVAHKSDVGGVRLGLDDGGEVVSAYADMAARFGPRLTLQAVAKPGIEIALGVLRDEQFGPVVVAAAGGVHIEHVHDRVLALPPLDRVRACAIVDALRMRPLLDGFRGRPAGDIGALCDALARVAALAVDLGARLNALDVNPVIVGPDGCTAVDAWLVPAQL